MMTSLPLPNIFTTFYKHLPSTNRLNLHTNSLDLRFHFSIGKMSQQQPIKYGDVLPVQGELVDKPVAPGDAAMMRKAETTIIGHNPSGSAASVMQSAATRNEAAGFTSHDSINEVLADQGVSITEQYVPGGRVLTETIGDQVVGQYVEQGPVVAGDQGCREESSITIGEALEAAAITAGDKPVEISDATAIREAEVRATGRNDIVAGGITATAQLAVTHNADVAGNDNKMKLSDILTDASQKLPSDKAATRGDMAAVAAAEMRNNDPNEASLYPAGVAACVAAAARTNESEVKFTNFDT